MYFKIENGKIAECDENSWKSAGDAIAVFTAKEWKSRPEFSYECRTNHRYDDIHFCKVERYPDCLFGTFRSVLKSRNGKIFKFAFYIFEGRIIFIDDRAMLESYIREMAERMVRREYTLERFLYDFLMNVISDDLMELENIQNRISKIEEDVLKGDVDKFNTSMMPIKKEVLKLYRYYGQLADIGDSLADIMDSECDFIKEDKRTDFMLFKEKALRFQGESQALRDYAMQVQDVYQSEIGIQQNNIMKMLTIVTTVFLPLTLIVGWYGMNFTNMPELQWTYGYPLVILLSIGIIILSMLFFKKKKYW